jgi:hypothetical protein
MLILTMINQFEEIFDSTFIERVRRVKVTRSLLRDIESEYQHLKLRAGFDD